MSPGKAASPRRRTDRRPGVEPREAQRDLRHRVKIGRLNYLVAVETDIPAAQIVRHAEDNVGSR